MPWPWDYGLLSKAQNYLSPPRGLLDPRIAELERDYDPAQAVLIGAGAAMSAGMDQIGRVGNLGLSGVADRWGFNDFAAARRADAEAIAQRRAEESRLYAPMRDAFPYATGFGEALPAAIGGPASAQAAIHFNMGREYLGEIAQGSQVPLLQDAYQSLRRF